MLSGGIQYGAQQRDDDDWQARMSAAAKAAKAKPAGAGPTAGTMGAMSPRPAAPSLGYQGPMPDGSSYDNHMQKTQQGIYAPGAVSENYRAPNKSKAAGLSVNWDQQRGAMQTQLNARLSQDAAAAQQAARVNAAKRGLMTGGSAGQSGIYQGMMRDIDRAKVQGLMSGMNEIDLNIGNRQQDYDLRRAGAEDGYNLNLQQMAMGLARQPYELADLNESTVIKKQQAQGAMLGNQGQVLSNRAQELANQFTEGTMEDRIKLIATQYRLSEADAAQAEHIAKYQGVYAALNFLGQVAPAAIKALAPGPKA